jgi:hypothetical protein
MATGNPSAKIACRPAGLEKFCASPSVPVGVAAYFLGVSRQRVYQKIWAGQLSVAKVGGSDFVTVFSICRELDRKQLKAR